ncbi:hypothetical protein GCM10009837_19700 [Streptomyces durmitorensis]
MAKRPAQGAAGAAGADFESAPAPMIPHSDSEDLQHEGNAANRAVTAPASRTSAATMPPASSTARYNRISRGVNANQVHAHD